MYRLELSTIALILPLAACGGADTVAPGDLSPSPFSTTAQGLVSQPEAESVAAQAAGGTVMGSELRLERGLEVYEVDVLRPSGTLVQVEVVRETGEILEMEARHHQAGDDDITLDDRFLSLEDALARGQEHEAGEVEEWELELDEQHRWRYEVRVRRSGDDLMEVELDAETGELRRHGPEAELEDSWEDEHHLSRMSTLPQMIRDAAQALLPGEVVKAEAEGEHGARVWKVTVRTTDGAEVELRFTATSARLYRAESETDGPFAYDLAPAGILSLNEARAAADLTAAESLSAWELERQSDVLVWRLEAEGGEDVEVDAYTGQVTAR